MTNKHVMVYEGRGRGGKKRKAVKKQSLVNRKLRALKRQVMNVLGGVGFVAVILVLFWLAQGGW